MEEYLMVQTILFSIFLGAFSIILSDKFRFPGIILFLGVGILFGQNALGYIQPKTLGGGVGTIITVFVCIILFEGGLSLNIKQISKMKVVLMKDIIYSILFILSAGFFATRYILNFPWEVSLIFSSLVIVTGPTVIKPIIRHIALSDKVKEFLNGESVLIDAIGAIISLVILEFILSKQKVGQVLIIFIKSIGIGLFIGLISGYTLYFLLTKAKIFSEASHSYLTIGFVFFTYWVSEILASESGLMAVMIAGIVLSNLAYNIKEKLLEFMEKITRIIISILFILLSANFNLNKLSNLFNEGMFIVFIIILARVPVIFLSMQKQNFSTKEKLFISWLGPKGIIALSVASIASRKLTENNIPRGEALEIIVFLLITTTVLLQGLSAKWVATKLQLSEKGDKNIVILGINEVTLLIAERLRNHTDILFVDSNRNNCIEASEKGFDYKLGNAFDPSIYAGVDLENYSTVLASTENNEVNILFCRYLKNYFGFNNLYAVINEKASVELSEIIKKEKIKLAFSSYVSQNSVNKTNLSYLARIKEFFKINSKIIHSRVVKNKSFIEFERGKYPIPEECLIILIKRNKNEFYIFHELFKLNLGDEILFFSTEENADKFERKLSAF